MNIYVEQLIEDVNNKIDEYYEHALSNSFAQGRHKEQHLKMKVGRKYIKLISGGSVWGFISRYDGTFKGQPIKKGDLLKAAGFNAPAKHSRGNLVDGTASWDMYGPSYLR